MAVLVASGTYLPKGLTFGPTNGPEDFQELVFIVFSRRLYKEWFLFLDDLSVATGRPAQHPPGPSGAHDVVTRTVEVTEKMSAAKGLGVAASSDPSPYAHWLGASSKLRASTQYSDVATGQSKMLYVCLPKHVPLPWLPAQAKSRGGCRA